MAFGLALVAFLVISLIMGLILGKRLMKDREAPPTLYLTPVLCLGKKLEDVTHNEESP